MSNLNYENPKLILDTSNLPAGNKRWRSPSNIALIKYWGKYGRQLPQNPSVSLTLSQAYTDTTLEYAPKQNINKDIDLTLYFDEQRNEAFEARVVSFLSSVIDIFPFLKQMSFTIRTFNSFPHSSGIASSASSMSALSMCLCSLENEFFGTLTHSSDFLQKASYVARLGSGSACRSVYPSVALWGETAGIDAASNLYAIPMENKVHPVFRTMKDAILLVSSGEKAVSSSAGHSLMDENPYAPSRYIQAKQRLNRLLSALETGDLSVFGSIVEGEAMTLHALMMTALPPYILMRPNTLAVIEKIQNYRKDTGYHVYFTLDAGPNVHVLYPIEIAKEVEAFIASDLLPLCEDQRWIADQVGQGAYEL